MTRQVDLSRLRIAWEQLTEQERSDLGTVAVVVDISKQHREGPVIDLIELCEDTDLGSDGLETLATKGWLQINRPRRSAPTIRFVDKRRLLFAFQMTFDRVSRSRGVVTQLTA